MSETQNIEYKSTWRDEYLKWICGFANSSGGSIFIGKDDAGKVVGLSDSERTFTMRSISNHLTDLSDRQVKAVLLAKEKGKITNSEYKTLNDVSRETATRDLKELIEKKLFKPSGQKGAGAFYTIN